MARTRGGLSLLVLVVAFSGTCDPLEQHRSRASRRAWERLQQLVEAPTPAGVVPLAPDLYKGYFQQDGQKLTIFDYNAKGLTPTAADQKASAKDTQSTADRDGTPGDRPGSEVIIDQLTRRKKELEEHFDENNVNRVKVTCPTFPYCNHIPPPPAFMPPPNDIEEATGQYPWEKKFRLSQKKINARRIRNGNLHNPLGYNGGQPESHWDPAWSVVDSKTGAKYKRSIYSPSLGKVYVTSKDVKSGSETNLETIQHKWKVVKGLPEYVGVDATSQVNYGDWKRSGGGVSKMEQRGGPNVQSIGKWYKDKDPSLSGFPGERAGGLSVGDQPDPPAQSHAYIPPPIFDPGWQSASESEEYLQFGANYVRE